MKIQIKTVTGITFPIDIEQEWTVLELKEVLSKKLKYDEIAQLKIIVKGKNLENDVLLKTIGLKQNEVIRLVKVMKKNEEISPNKIDEQKVDDPKSSINQSDKKKKQQQNSNSKQPTTNNDKKSQLQKTQQSTNLLLQSSEQKDNKNLPSTHQDQVVDETKIASLIKFGFEKQKCKEALQKCGNNVSSAIDYLVKGNTPQKQKVFSQIRVEDKDEYEIIFKSFLNTPQFIEIRSGLKNDLKLLEPILNQISDELPELYIMIRKYPQAFQNILMADIEKNVNHPWKANLSIKQDLIIQRLMFLGFTEYEAVDAFISCQRDENMAANYLFDRQNL